MKTQTKLAISGSILAVVIATVAVASTIMASKKTAQKLQLDNQSACAQPGSSRCFNPKEWHLLAKSI